LHARTDLSATGVTDAGLVHLEALSKLERLEIISTKVSAKGIERLKKALPNCSIFSVKPKRHSVD
jgi:hypothetical protein